MPNKARNTGKNAKSFKPNIVNVCFNSLSFFVLGSSTHCELWKKKQNSCLYFTGVKDLFNVVNTNHQGEAISWFLIYSDKHQTIFPSSIIQSFQLQVKFKYCVFAKQVPLKKEQFPRVSRSVLGVGSPVSHTFSHSFTFFWVK